MVHKKTIIMRLIENPRITTARMLKATGLSESQLQKCLQELEEAGFLEVV